jgi:hypothetical protein
MKETIIDIEQLSQDAHNFNRGTEEGRELMQRSLQQLGAGRSILIDKDNNIIAGNKTQEAARKAGIRRVRIIETSGDELVAVKRTDIDIDSAKGRELALVDNLATQINLQWDEAQLEAITGEVEGFDPEQWGYEPPEFGDGATTSPEDEKGGDGNGEGSQGTKDNYNIIYSLVFNNEQEQETWFKFLRKLKNLHPEMETISERVIHFITNSQIWQE